MLLWGTVVKRLLLNLLLSLLLDLLSNSGSLLLLLLFGLLLALQLIMCILRKADRLVLIRLQRNISGKVRRRFILIYARSSIRLMVVLLLWGRLRLSTRKWYRLGISWRVLIVPSRGLVINLGATKKETVKIQCSIGHSVRWLCIHWSVACLLLLLFGGQQWVVHGCVQELKVGLTEMCRRSHRAQSPSDLKLDLMAQSRITN